MPPRWGYLVAQLLDTKQHIATAQHELREGALCGGGCDYLDGEIGRLVYGLYGLTLRQAQDRLHAGKNSLPSHQISGEFGNSKIFMEKRFCRIDKKLEVVISQQSS